MPALLRLSRGVEEVDGEGLITAVDQYRAILSSIAAARVQWGQYAPFWIRRRELEEVRVSDGREWTFLHDAEVDLRGWRVEIRFGVSY